MDKAVFDRIRNGYRVFIGDLGSRIGKYEIEREFKSYGSITDVWVARNPPGFAFLVFKHADDAERAVRKLHGRHVCGRKVRVEHARPYEERRRLQLESMRDKRYRVFYTILDRYSRLSENCRQTTVATLETY